MTGQKQLIVRFQSPCTVRSAINQTDGYLCCPHCNWNILWARFTWNAVDLHAEKMTLTRRCRHSATTRRPLSLSAPYPSTVGVSRGTAARTGTATRFTIVGRTAEAEQCTPIHRGWIDQTFLASPAGDAHA